MKKIFLLITTVLIVILTGCNFEVGVNPGPRYVIWDNNNDIVLYDSNGNNLGTIFTTTSGSSFDVFPDGKRLAVAIHSHNKINIINLKGEVQKTINMGTIDVYYPSVSPDGSKFLFDNGTDMYVIDLNGKILKTIGGFIHGAWSPGGKYIVAHDALNIVHEIELPTMTQYDTWQPGEFPSYSPSGNRILCNNANITQLDATNYTEINHFTGPGNSTPLYYSKDGSKIYYINGSDLRVMNSSGSNPRILFTHTAHIMQFRVLY